MKQQDVIHVLHILHHMKMGGVEHLVFDMTNAFQQLGIKTTICCLDGVLGELGEQLRDNNIDVRVLNRRPGFDYKLFLDIASLIKELNPDIVHAHQYTPYFYGITASILAKKKETLFSEHGRLYPDRMSLKRVVYNRLVLLPHTDIITVDSKHLRNALIRYEKIPSNRIRILANGIKLGPFSRITPENRIIQRKLLGIKEDEFAMGMISRLDPIKDHKTLICAFKKINEEFPNTSLFLAGKGPEYETIQSLIGELGLNDKVKLLGYYEDLYGLLNALDLYILSSHLESAPLGVMEAMAAGLPVIATDAGGTGEIIINGEDGYLVPPRDPEEMARAMKKIIVSPDAASNMAQKGKQKIYNYYSFDRMIEDYRNLYREMLDITGNN